MKRQNAIPPRPTQAELEILCVLWQRGPSSVREVQQTLSEARAMGYTTVLVARDERERTHVYRAALAQEQTQRQLVSDLLERAFDGSASQLILQALATKRATQDEMDEIRRMLDKAQRRSS
ncbi:MAG: BlaI/MecI/CopY family transcriptional regulator [Candidatus Eisenbacteria bacterium]|uniref:BlaI/MecI/CopY family transcriptional regulator n=1 Tax=Eiseniibacteriota bacterium TaxID=2212470 RepID=A0A538U0Z0_UNCEI|nr:MAG: BlaI/MecI/CopY family transcriptional regulator [Candidatus Eisenbacteria bacterium]